MPSVLIAKLITGTSAADPDLRSTSNTELSKVLGTSPFTYPSHGPVPIFLKKTGSMDDATLKRLQDVLGREDVWTEPADVPEAIETQTTEIGDASEKPPTSVFELPPDSDEYSDNEYVVQRPRKQGKSKQRKSHTNSSRTLNNSTAAFHSVEEIKSQKFADYGLQPGEKSPEGMKFCPWDMVKCYPNNFIGKLNYPLASPFFEREALVTDMIWDFFYIQDPSTISSSRPILFVPTEQFQHLLDIINASLNIALTIPPGKNTEKFEVKFGELNTPRPRFLLRCQSLEHYDTVRDASPAVDCLEAEENFTSMAGMFFTEKLQSIASWSKGSKTDKKTKKDKRRKEAHQSWGRSAKRVQRYLGLRQKVDVMSIDDCAPQGQRLPQVQPLDLAMNMPCHPEGDVVLVCVDVEAYEFNHDLVTEIGFAVLDTRKLANVPPGSDLKVWFSFIEGRHLRIKENSHALNRVHVQGHERNFNFG